MWKRSNDDFYKDFQLYHYIPTLVGGIIFTVIFGILLIIFIVKLIISSTKATNLKQRSVENQALQDLEDVDKDQTSLNEVGLGKLNNKNVKKFIFGSFAPMIVGLAFEVVGYICRCLGHYNKESLGPYVIQSVFLLVAPSLIAATIYMIFGRLLILLDAEKSSFIPVRFLTSFFVCGDVLSFLLQAAGGGLMAKADFADTGSKIVVGGLVVQIVFFGFFLISELYFTIRIRSHPTSISQLLRESNERSGVSAKLVNWRMPNISLILASILIMMRCIVRLVEFAQGFTGYIMTHEVFIYVFDGLLMMFACVIILLSQPELVLAELTSHIS